jgi:hypothetical protein
MLDAAKQEVPDPGLCLGEVKAFVHEADAALLGLKIVRLAVARHAEPVINIAFRHKLQVREAGYTHCWYHYNKQSFFNELFAFNLPIPVRRSSASSSTSATSSQSSSVQTRPQSGSQSFRCSTTRGI